MGTIFLCIVIFLGILAVIDLTVGVSNDAVNFLNSAIGAKAAPFKVVLAVAGAGVILGASLSNGMMDIARNGIYHPEYFTFMQVIIICVTAMVANILLMNIFNSLGLPTSTTVSMIFNLLGASFCISMIKIGNGEAITKIQGDDFIVRLANGIEKVIHKATGGHLGDFEISQLINTSKALQVIIAIFMSVAIAFMFGAIVQYITRLIFTFQYKKRLNYLAGVFGGLALTCIIYFLIFKGFKKANFMTEDAKAFLTANAMYIIAGAFVLTSILMQTLHWLKVNIFKIIILAGTFALALAFAGNDLVNFIGIPLSGVSAYQDYTVHGDGAYDSYLMGANNLPASTPIYFLIGAGAIMVLALVFSKSAHNVIRTSVNLSSQDEVEEGFGSSRMSRRIVRLASKMSDAVDKVTPQPVQNWIDSRFSREGVALEKGAAFDLIRASVNLVLAALLISIGTSYKLPLSTTYVTFMVAMGTALADRAWGRESSVSRLTGVMSVVGGWFVTAAGAFLISGTLALIMYYGGFIAMALLIVLAIFLLFSNHLFTKKKNDKEDKLFIEIMNSEKEEEIWGLLSQHVRLNQLRHLENIASDYTDLTCGFLEENLSKLSLVQDNTEVHKRQFKAMRRKETISLRRLSNEAVLEKNMWFHLGANACLQMSYALERSSVVCSEHVGNNFNPMPEEFVAEFVPVRDEVLDYIKQVHQLISSEKIEDVKKTKAMGKELRRKVKEMRKEQMKRTYQGGKERLKVSLVYMNMLQETTEVLVNLRHLVGFSQHLLEGDY